jgi:dihydrofolate reductase
MRKLIAAMNMTLDGYCDHTSGIADEEIHQHYTDLLNESDSIIYGRVTYQLMEYWRPFVDQPSGEKSSDDFAEAIDNISKIVYSRTLPDVDWRNTELKREIIVNDISALKQHPGKNILVGSPSMIVQLGNLSLIDEYQISIQPMIVGAGLQLFKSISGRIDLKLLKTKTFECGALMLYYQPTQSIGADRTT